MNRCRFRGSKLNLSAQRDPCRRRWGCPRKAEETGVLAPDLEAADARRRPAQGREVAELVPRQIADVDLEARDLVRVSTAASCSSVAAASANSMSSNASSIWSGWSFSDRGPKRARWSSRTRCSSRALRVLSSAFSTASAWTCASSAARRAAEAGPEGRDRAPAAWVEFT